MLNIRKDFNSWKGEEKQIPTELNPRTGGDSTPKTVFNRDENTQIEYLRNEYAASFVMTSDGKYANYGICGVKVCRGGPGHTATLLKSCKKKLK